MLYRKEPKMIPSGVRGLNLGWPSSSFTCFTVPVAHFLMRLLHYV